MKFTKEASLDDYEILTDSGFQPIARLYETIPMECLTITLDDGSTLTGADKHIVVGPLGQTYLEDLEVGDELYTQDGTARVVAIAKAESQTCYDIEVASKDHLYYTGNILSHNTTSTAQSYILHYALTHPYINIGILANKGRTAEEILTRIKLSYEMLPWFLQVGVSKYNVTSVKFGNGTEIFAAATSNSSIRGKSCVTSDTKVTIEINDNIFHGNMSTISIEQTPKLYCIYKTTNKVNGKQYIGFHGTDTYPLDFNEEGSIFIDGYLGSGKLLSRAIEKYAPESFQQELIECFDSRADAEALERSLVNEEWVNRDDTYNISIGGNVCILVGASNGFYGKKHNADTKAKLSVLHKNNKHHSSHYDNRIFSHNRVWIDYIVFKAETGITRDRLIKEIGLGNYWFSDAEKQRAALDKFNRIFEADGSYKAHALAAISASKRFKGKSKSGAQRRKIGEAQRAWIAANPIAHKARMDKINHAPTKIEKTANAHRDMKRSDEARHKMSEAKVGKAPSNKGRIMINNGIRVRYILQGDVIPDGWERGGIKR